MSEKNANLEIERKYLVRKEDLPTNYKKYDKCKIEQSFICLKPAIRIRKADNKFYLTVKSRPINTKKLKDDLVRNEYEIEIDKKTYNFLKKKIDGRTIFKTRYFIPYEHNKNKFLIELDIFEKELKGLIYAEVEFDNVKDAMNFDKPSWFYKDVTGIDRYKNTSLSICKDFSKLLSY